MVDGGNTHSFLDDTKLKSELVETQPMQVLVANENHLSSKYECPSFKWKVGEMEFTAAVRTLPIGRYHIVLEVDWSGSLGPVTFDFKTLQLKFQYQDQPVNLVGKSQDLNPVIQEMSAAAFVRSCQKKEIGLI